MKWFLVLTLLIPSLLFAKAFPNVDESKDSATLFVGQDIEDLGIELSDLTPLNVGSNPNSELDGTEPFSKLEMRYPTYSHKAADKLTAIAVYSRGRPIVLYSPKAARKYTAKVMGSILQHEYCHHDLGHRGRGGEAADEAQADCCASFNIDKFERRDMLEEIIAFNAEKECKYDPKTPLTQIRGSHPCGEQRAYIYNYCSSNKKTKLSKEFLENEFPASL